MKKIIKMIIITNLEEGNELLRADEGKFSKTLSHDVTCSLFLTLAVFEEKSKDGLEVWLED